MAEEWSLNPLSVVPFSRGVPQLVVLKGLAPGLVQARAESHQGTALAIDGADVLARVQGDESLLAQEREM